MRAWLVALVAVGIACPHARAVAQPLITFESWVDGCDRASPCPDGFFDGDVAAFEVVSNVDGEPCLFGNCVKVTWMRTGEPFPHIRPLGFAVSPTSAWVQAWFYLPPELITQVDTDTGLRLTLLQINTNTSDYYARIVITPSASGNLQAILSTRSATNVEHIGDLAAGWHLLELGVELSLATGDMRMFSRVDGGDLDQSDRAIVDSGLAIVSGWGLGYGSFDGAPPRVGIENLCFAESAVTALDACGSRTLPDAGMPDAGVDAAADTGVTDSAIADTSAGAEAGIDSSVPDGTTFRGGGGCECSTSGNTRWPDGFPLALVIGLWPTIRRRRDTRALHVE